MERLKKVEVSEERTGTSLKDIIEREKEANRRLLEADLDSWYTAVKDYTYLTTFVPLSIEEAKAMVQAAKGTQTANSQNLLRELLERIAHGIQEVCPDCTPEVFAKLSSRSPKDATNRIAKKNEILISLLNESKVVSKNDMIAAIFQAHISSFKLSTAEEVLSTLISSDRIINDEIPLALEHCEKKWKEHIAIRKWSPIPIKYELRGFVYDNRLTGLCQYYDEVCYPELVANKGLILKIVLEFFDVVKNLIPLNPKEYVLDMIVDLEQQKAWIVEINPFGKPDGMGTGTVMFNLKSKEDADILFGVKPFEFRVETEPLSDQKFESMIGPEYRLLLSNYFE